MPLSVARKNLIENVLSDLGRQFRGIEVSVEQIDDAITETAELFCEYAPEAREPGKILYEVTDADITAGYIQLPSSVMYVTSIHRQGSSGGVWSTGIPRTAFATGPFGSMIMSGGPIGRAFILPATNYSGLDTNYWTYGPQFHDQTMGAIVMTKTMMATMKGIGGGKIRDTIRYNGITKRLYINEIPLSAGDNLAIIVEHCFEPLYGPTDPVPHFGLKWFENHVGLLVLNTWYQNMSKYGQVTLPGGNTIDFEAKLQTVSEALNESQEELIQRYAHYYGGIVTA